MTGGLKRLDCSSSFEIFNTDTMQAVIMAGGFGTRLRPLTNNLPKPMVPIVNKPILEHLITLLKNHNIKEYIILLYYQPEIIKDFFGDGSEFGVSIKYILPDRDYGTAGAVKLSEKFIKDNFLVTDSKGKSERLINEYAGKIEQYLEH